MSRLNFGAFLAPHHPIGEHPMLQFRRDLDLVEHLDRLGYDEFWCGEHHSSGWEMIASPEMFLAAAGAGPVYKLLGKDALDTEVWPGANEPILHDLSYFMHDGGHGMVPGDWNVYVEFLKMHLHPER